MIYYNSDQYEHKKYTTEFCNSNFGNYFDIAIASKGIKKDYINSGCVYTNINNKYKIFCYNFYL